MNSILPENSTNYEKAIVQSFHNVIAKINNEIDIKNLWNADLCHVEFLVYLASALDVDFDLYNNFDEKNKREYIKKSIEIHRKKGTVQALKLALSSLDRREIKIKEWYENNKKAHTIQANISIDSKITKKELKTINKVIQKNKNIQTATEINLITNFKNLINFNGAIAIKIKERK